MLFCNGFLGKFVSSQVFQGAVPRIAAALALAAAFACGGPEAWADTQLPVQALPSAASGLRAQDQVDGANGSFVQTIPIQVPPFFGIEPKLSLSYDSKLGNGPLGMGWRVDGLSVIQRASSGRGAPHFDAADIFLLDGQELVPCASAPSAASCTASGTHTTKIESFIRITRNDPPANNWILRRSDGTKYTYLPIATYTGGSGSYDTDFRWLLSTVIDTHGNTVTYNYACPQPPALPNQPNVTNNPECYIDAITYNQTTVTFHRETRADVYTYGLGAGLVQVSFRFNTIDIQRAGVKSRAYKFLYNFVPTGTQRRRLASVQQFGSDFTLDGTGTVTGGTSLPPITLGYSGAPTAFISTHWTPAGQGTFGVVTDWLTGDFNGDGKTDFVRKISACTAQVQLSTGSSFTQATWTITPASGTACIPPSSFTTKTWDIGDFNLDGKTDLIVYCCESTASVAKNFSAYVYMSTGTGFVFQSFVQNLVKWDMGAKWVSGDVGGDGFTDFFEDRMLWSNSIGCYINVAVNTGTAFSLSQFPVTDNCSSGIQGNPNVNNLTPGDVNGDGRTDFLRINVPTGSSNPQIEYFRNTGSTFSRFPLPISAAVASITGEKWFVADVNGDGQLDVLRAYAPTGATTINLQAFIFGGGNWIAQDWATAQGTKASLTDIWMVGDVNGDGRKDIIVHGAAQSAVTYNVYESIGTSFAFQNWGSATGGPGSAVGDFNGDGMTDVAAFFNSGGWRSDVQLSSGPLVDLLTSVVNSLGGTVSAGYTPSTTWSNTYLPVIFPTVNTVITNDGRAQPTSIATTTYQYSGGFWHVLERRFRGFRTATATLPCGTAPCPTVTTNYLRSAAHVAAKIESLDQKDGAGTLLRHRLEEYTINSTTLPYTSFNTASWQYVYDGAANKRTKVTRSFNGFGNIVQSTSYGDFDVPGDEITTATDFAFNSGPYIAGLPNRARTFAGVDTTGTKLAESQVCYDSDSPGANGCTAPVTVGEPKKTRAWLNPPGVYLESNAEFDSLGNVTARIDPLGRRTEFVYDPTFHTFLTEVHDPLFIAGDTRHKMTVAWDTACALPANSHDLNNQQTTYTYDKLCRPTRTDRPGADFTTNIFVNIGTATGEWIETQTPGVGTDVVFSRVVFDGFGRTWRNVAEGTSTAAILSDKTFDLRGNVATETAPYYNGVDTPQTMNFTYDTLNRRTQRKFADNATLNGSYGLSTVTGAFERTTVTDELNRPVTVHTDAYGRTVRKDRTLSSVTVSTSYQYDLLGRLIGITDNAGNHWTYVYDSLGRRTDATDPDLGHWTYQYDPAGQLTDQTDAKSQVTHFTYDGTGRVLTKTALFGTAQPAATTYTYDEARTGFFNVGHLTTAANAAETMQYNFDAAGHQLQEIHIVASTTYTTTTTYDAGGRLTSRQYPDGDSVGSVSTPIGYDGAGRLTSVPGILSSVTYTARDQQAIVTRANSTTTTYGYSTQRGWLTGITTTVGASTILGLTYSRDTHGRINGVTSTPAGASYTYGYDDFDRLLSADNTTDNTFDQTFTYDSVDNMLTNSLVGPYTYPAPGTARPHGVTNAGGQPYGYDANGSMTSAAGDTLTYDGENRLASDNGVQFVYGADGNRLKKISGSTTTLYLSADVELTGSQYTKYLPGDALRQGTTTYWLHRDNLNSVRMLSNSSSGVVETGQYRPYGERQGFAGPVAESRGYIGERHDDETGLMYLNARYYDPVLGRFIQADPTTPLLKGVGINRYAYTSNNPITRMDPTGLADSGCDFSGCGVFGPIGSGASLLNLGSIGSVGLAGAAADVLPIEEAPVAASTLEAGSGVGAGATAVVETGGVIVVVCILICPSTAQAPEGDKNGPKAVLPPPVLSQSQSDSGQKSNSGAQTNASTAAATQTKDVRLIIIDYNDYPTVAEHILKAQAAGQPIVLTYDPEGADARRSAATGGLPKVPGFHWDEYPPAAFLEGGVGASVELVHEQDNWGSGGSMAAQMRGAEAGDLFVIEVWKDPE